MNKIKFRRLFKSVFYQNNDAYSANSVVFKIFQKSMLQSKSYEKRTLSRYLQRLPRENFLELKKQRNLSACFYLVFI